MHYEEYSVFDFVKDEGFNQWIKHGENDQQWQQWLAQNPSFKEVVEEARQIALLIDIDTHHLSREEIKRLWQNIDVSITSGQEPLQASGVNQKEGRKRKSFMPLFRVAAAIVFLLISIAAFWVYLQSDSRREFTTGFGEQNSFYLPDSSRVTLNANSKLTINKTWGQGQREVWLDGEAFFQVKKRAVSGKKEKSKFIVHANQVDVEVVGTAFNVKNRHSNTQIVLNEGEVKLYIPKIGSEEDKSKSKKKVSMQPGELVEYSAKTQQFTQEVVNAEQYSAWRKNQLVFDKTPLGEIGKILEDLYGMKVKIKEKHLRERTFSGTIPNDSLSFVLKVLSESFYINIEQKKNTILIRKIKDQEKNGKDNQ